MNICNFSLIVFSFIIVLFCIVIYCLNDLILQFRLNRKFLVKILKKYCKDLKNEKNK